MWAETCVTVDRDTPLSEIFSDPYVSYKPPSNAVLVEQVWETGTHTYMCTDVVFSSSRVE